MSALDELRRKSLNEMDDIEIAIWYTSAGTTAYDMDEAANKLAALRAERDEAVRLLGNLLTDHEDLSGKAVEEISDFLDSIRNSSEPVQND